MQLTQRKQLKLSNLTQALDNIWSLCCRPTFLIMGVSCVSLASASLYAETQEQPDGVTQTSSITVENDLKQKDIEDEKYSHSDNLIGEAVSTSSDVFMTEKELQMFNAAESIFAQNSEYDLTDENLTSVDLSEIQDVAALAQSAKDAAQLTERTATINLDRDQFLNADIIVSEGSLRQDAQQNNQNVTALLTQLEQDPVVVPTLESDTKKDGINAAQSNEDDFEEVKKTWLDRLLRRDPTYTAQIAKKSPSINVVVCTENSDIANNIKAKLAGFTVEAFQDFEYNSTQNKTVPLLDTKVAHAAKGLFAEATCGQNFPKQELNRGPGFAQVSNLTKQAAEAMGYYDAEFAYQKLDNDTLMVWVKPNQPVTVKEQTITFVESDDTGKESEVNNLGFRLIKTVPDLRIGDILNHQKYETTKNRILTAASNFGYFDAHWRIHDVRVDLPENVADIKLKYDTKQRYKFEEVEFRVVGERQELPLRPSVLRNLAAYYAADGEYVRDWNDSYYNSWRITTLSNNLTNSRYFNYALVNVVKPDPQPVQLEYPPEVVQAQQEMLKTTSESETVKPESVEIDPALQAVESREKAQISAEVKAEIKAEQDEMTRLKEQAFETKKIPVIVYLNADNPNNLETGIGYGTDTGVRLRTQYRRAIVNDKGHSFDANIELSEVRQAFDARYMIPVKNKNPLNDYINLIGGYEREVRDRIGQGVELEIESAVFGAERVIKRRLTDWQHNFAVRYRLDRINTTGLVDSDDLPDAFRIITDSPEQQSLLVGYEASKLTQDRAINPTQGIRQFYRVDVGSESLFTETDLAIVNAGWRFLYSLGETADHQFVGRTDLGYIVTDNFDKVPYNLRYFAGGDQSIRGFDYKSLSPQEDDLLIGGQALAVGSLEYNYQFKDGWRAAVFTDFGNAYNENFSNPIKYGAGLGIRWASPVGPIRIDVAAGVSEPSVPIRLHFFIGPAL